MDKNKDQLYRTQISSLADFSFDEEVTSVFPDMISRSVPAYASVVDLCGVLVADRLPEDGICYDVGCSRGAVTAAILKAVTNRRCTIHAIDSSAPMIAAAQSEIDDHRVQFHNEDIDTVPIENAYAVVLNLVLQFIEVPSRVPLLARIYAGLNSDGLLILTEKIEIDPEFERLHRSFKRFNGYSELEIAQKRTALEAVMHIESLKTHLDRLRDVGFQNPIVWFQCLNWVSILAYK